MPNALADVGNSDRSSEANGLLINDTQPKLCSICGIPVTVESNGQQSLACPACALQSGASTTGSNEETYDSFLQADRASATSSSDAKPSKGTNGAAKPVLKVVKVEFPGTIANDSLSPTTPQSSATNARTLSLRSPADSQPLSSALRAHLQTQSLLDPYPVLTRTRVSSRGYDCLYPGALFEGLQTNKSKEHRVSVRIVDVNMEQSRLEGFLTIHDLTDQWPEITTFFEGQIIGDRYGFVTGDWGANDKIDAQHWSQFHPYHHILTSEVVKPKQTLKPSTSTLDRGFAFMRWKERFLVPDHRVTSINGASYAGFYYICLEFGSLMAGLHADALSPPVEEVDEEMQEASSRPTGSGTRQTRYSAEGHEEDKPSSLESGPPYWYGTSPYTASSSYAAPSTSPVTGTHRITRVNLGHRNRRASRASIYSAGSVAAQVHDHSHGHSHYSHTSTSPSTSHILATYGSSSRDVEMRAEEDVEIGIEEALELDPVEELRTHVREERQSSEARSRSRTRSRDVGRYRSIERMKLEGDLDERADANWGWYGFGRRWMGPARLTGYYHHSEDQCDMYQKLELHHVSDRTRGCFEFR